MTTLSKRTSIGAAPASARSPITPVGGPLSLTWATCAPLIATVTCVPSQVIDFGRPLESRVERDIPLVIKAHAGERDPAELRDGVGDAGGDHVVRRLRLLEHQPHCPHVVTGETPVALGIEVPHGQLRGEAEGDPSGSIGHFS